MVEGKKYDLQNGEIGTGAGGEFGRGHRGEGDLGRSCGYRTNPKNEVLILVKD